MNSHNATVPEAMSLVIAESGLKQYVIAERMGLSSQQLTDMLANRRIIKARDIERFCSALKISPNRLFKSADKDSEQKN